MSDLPQRQLFVTHFGNGDEADQDLILKYLADFGCTVKSITIIPGNNYGHVELSSEAEGKLVMESLIANNAVIVGKRVLVFFCTTIVKDGLKK